MHGNLHLAYMESWQVQKQSLMIMVMTNCSRRRWKVHGPVSDSNGLFTKTKTKTRQRMPIVSASLPDQMSDPSLRSTLISELPAFFSYQLQEAEPPFHWCGPVVSHALQ